MARADRRHGVGEAVMIKLLGQHRCSRYLFVDALDGVVVRVSDDKDDRYVAYLSKPPSGLDPFATSFEIDVHQDNIGLIFHCTQKGLLSICRSITNVEAQCVHVCF